MPCETCHRVHDEGRCPATTGIDYLSFSGLSVADEAPDGDWIVEGLFLPYGEELERFDWLTGATRWVFEQGSAEVREGAQLFYGHDHLYGAMPIGLVLETEQRPEGLWGRARISKTDKGAEVYRLLQDGVLARFSVGLDRAAATTRLDDADSASPLLVFESIPVWETSVVPNPAYQSARVEAVLARTNNPRGNRNMECQHCHRVHPDGVTECQPGDNLASAADLAALSESLNNLERRIATLGDLGNEGDGLREAPADSYGEFLQMLAANDAEALDFLAYAGGVVGDLGGFVRDAWVGDILREVTVNRHVINFFRSAPLPATGMNVEYGKPLSDTTQVGKQAAEGDVLPYGKIAFTTDTAPVGTYGGWGEMTRQQIERSAMQVVEKFYRALDRRYGLTTEGAARSVLNTATGAHAVADSDLTTADGWIDFLVEAAIWYDDKGLSPEGIFVGKNRFKALAKLRTGDAPDAPYLLDRNNGTIEVTALTGKMFNLPIRLLGNGFGADNVRVAHPDAIQTFEAGGAPFRLQDGDITNLTNAFSIYGYMAVADEEPDLIVVPDES